MKISIVDNYDSFTYNLVHFFEQFADEITVIRNDTGNIISELNSADRIVLSPGPGLPKNAGQLMTVIQHFYSKKPMLGVCLGHQALAEFFGAKLYNFENVIHGKSTIMSLSETDYIYQNLPTQLNIGHYHSWVVRSTPEFNSSCQITGKSTDNEIMSFKHKVYNIRGLQYHPESILTPRGLEIIENWIQYC